MTSSPRALLLLLPLFALLLVSGVTAEALEITSVSPTTAAPGAVVTVRAGLPLGEEVQVLLGQNRITPDAIRGDRLFFTVPQLPEGNYLLQLRSAETVSAGSFSLQVINPPPRILSMSPRNIDICSAPEDLEVTVRGENFQAGSRILFDGKAIPYDRASAEELTFTPPLLEAGVYGVQVINPDDRSSLPYSLYINNIPEIHSVSRGEDFVNAYQLIIEGKNFFFDSALVVTTYPGELSGLPPSQKVIIGRTQTSSGQEQLPGRTQSDTVRYVDCHTIIYKRFPYSEQDKPMSLQVINPDGKASSTYHLSAP